MTVWLLLTLTAALGPLWVGHRLAQRASAQHELADFEAAGSRVAWDVYRMSLLDGAVGEFVRQWRAETVEALRVDLLCEKLADVDSETRGMSRQLVLLRRVQLASGMLLGISIVLQSLSGAGWTEAAWGIMPPITCGAGAAICGWIERASGRMVERRRDAWDALSQLLSRPLMSVPRMPGEDPRSDRRDGRYTVARSADENDCKEDQRWNLGTNDVVMEFRARESKQVVAAKGLPAEFAFIEG